MSYGSKLPSLLNNTFAPPDSVLGQSNLDWDQYYRPWGFTIYRTSYEPVEASDMQWEALLAKISEQVTTEISRFQKPGEEQVAARLKELFFLDPQSNPALLSGKSMAEVRLVALGRARPAKEPSEGEEYVPDPTWPGPGLFLLADAEVLEGVSKDPFFWVKCVDAEHDEWTEENPPRNNFFPPPPGWFCMTTNSIVDLCLELKHCDWKQLPPQVQKWRDYDLYNGELTGSDPASSMSSGK